MIFILSVIWLSHFCGNILFPEAGIPPEMKVRKKISLKKVWDSANTLRTPESVLYYPEEDILFVSNINGNGADKDNNGFISKLTLDGKIKTLQWATGLSAPKGMGISGNKLYVTDIDRLVMLDVTAGAILKTYQVAEPAYLNDVTVAADGVIYISDNRNDKIYYLQNDTLQIFMEGAALQKPNGLFAEAGRLVVGSMQHNALRFIDLQNKQITEVADGLGASDGVVSAGKGNYFVSDWNGRIFWVSSKGAKKLLLDTTGAKINSADIEYIPAKKLLLVPTFHDNRVAAYKVK
jgi:sugar lactone lactonase YvrE